LFSGKLLRQLKKKAHFHPKEKKKQRLKSEKLEAKMIWFKNG